MLQVDPQLSDWYSTSDDEELLLDVRTATSTDIGCGGKPPCCNKGMNTCMDPKDLSEHLQTVMEWSAEDLFLLEQEELELDASIYEFRDVFNIYRPI